MNTPLFKQISKTCDELAVMQTVLSKTLSLFFQEMQVVPVEAAETCTWTETENRLWMTGCGESYKLTVGAPSENKMKFCCLCGRLLEEELFKNTA